MSNSRRFPSEIIAIATVMMGLLLCSAVGSAGADDKEKNQAFVRAAMGGYLEKMERLIQEGADVNLKAKEGTTALSLAAALHRKEIVDLLKKHGAKESSGTL